MKTVWIIGMYGNIEGELWRDYRNNVIGKALSKQGYEVIWWTPSFSHHFKKQRCKGWKDIKVCNGFITRLVPTTGYTKNFGLKRVLKDWTYEIAGYKRAKSEKKPDFILGGSNPLCFGYFIFRYAKVRNIPVLLDVKDLWPEYFENYFEGWKRKVIHLVLFPVYYRRKKMYEQVAGLYSLGKNYLDMTLGISDRLKELPAAVVYNGIDVDKYRSKCNDSIAVNKYDLSKKENETWVVFSGTFGSATDIPTIIEAAALLKGNKNIKFFFSGNGLYKDLIEEAERKSDNINYLGSIPFDDLTSVYSMSDIGLLAYTKKSNSDMPDKFYDYTAAGLALVNSLKMEVKGVIEKEKLGLQYIDSDAEDLAQKIELLSKDKMKLNEFKANSYSVSNRYHVDLQMRKLIALMETAEQETLFLAKKV